MRDISRGGGMGKQRTTERETCKHKNLEPFERKPLPGLPGFWKLLGPGLIWMALAQGSGELIWWPYIVAKYGAAFLFLLIPACLLSFALLRPQGKLPQGFEIAVVQADFFAVAWGDTGRVLFLVIAGAFLADTWLATADCVSRVHLDAITTIWPKLGKENLRPWYYGTILLLAVLTSVTMYLERPGPLIIVSALIGFAGTVIYSTALIVLNHFHLPRQLAPRLRPGLLSLGSMIFVTSCYLVLAALYLYFEFGL